MGSWSPPPPASSAGLATPLLSLLAVLLAAAAWRWWLRGYAATYARFRRLELAMPGPVSLPVLGSALSTVHINSDNVLDVALAIWGGRNDQLSRVSIFNHLVVFVTDAEHIAKVVRDRRFNAKPWFFYSFLAEVMGGALLASPGGPTWKSHRSFILPLFHLSVLERFVDVFAEEAAALVERLRPLAGCGDRDVAIGDHIARAAALTVMRTTLTSVIDEKDQADIELVIQGLQDVLAGLNARTLRPWLWPHSVFGWTAAGRAQARFNQTTSDLADRLIARKMAEVNTAVNNHRDDVTSCQSQVEGRLGFKKRCQSFFELVLDAKLSGQEGTLSDSELKDETKGLFAGAVETSPNTLGFILKMLSIRPDVQDRVFEELQDVLGESDRPVTSADLPRLEYLDRVIKETLRIFPVAPFLARLVSEETELGGKVIPAGSTLALNILGAHRDPRYHPEPLRFDPDRFLPEREAAMHPYSYLPFSAGPRNCIGQRYAVLQMKTFLATLLRAFRLLPAADGISHPEHFRLSFDIVLRQVGGAKVRLQPR